MQYAIEAEQLQKRYGKVTALDGLTFRVEAGSVYALLGPNGAGKSTTVRVLTTLARADGGEARVCGLPVEQRAGEVRRRIGVVAQKTGAFGDDTGRANLLLQGRLFGMRGETLKKRVNELLEQFALTGAADRPVAGYSGGMRRKLDVALGLIHLPEVLFLDEPTAGLDPEARATLWRGVSRLPEQGVTVVLTTHYLEEAERLADRVALLRDGRIVAGGTPDGLKAELGVKTLDEVYLHYLGGGDERNG